jgi:hypothetical protein
MSGEIENIVSASHRAPTNHPLGIIEYLIRDATDPSAAQGLCRRECASFLPTAEGPCLSAVSAQGVVADGKNPYPCLGPRESRKCDRVAGAVYPARDGYL